ncbi:Immunity protein 53 [Pedobacter insulae]|uniref:Immunity protein 53 n=1 Tax=Pedobacter insulae TaxID=414048 RepID=A0A1I3A8K5_9SPHI|nr:Imm53 family immunity protein [Pedobacter insulae]SFH46443.1 Immunity protein 53 [Pedobacter insulae]
MEETSLAGKLLEPVEGKASTDDWYILSSDGRIFKGYGDASKLIFILEAFKDFASTNKVEPAR